jgi:uncharacterized protein (TIGR02466 family)
MPTLDTPNVFPLFSIPVYKTNVSGYENDVIEFDNLSSDEFYLNEYTTKQSIITNNQNILLDSKFSNLKSIIDEAVEDYVFGLLKLPRHIKLKCVCSWIVLGYPGSVTKPHIHINSVFSGIFYLKSEENSGDLVFSVPPTYNTYATSTIFPVPVEFNMYNSTSWSIKPKTNDIIIFPSHLDHSVTENKSGEVRAALAFNYFVVGDVSYQNSNVLVL